jgi:glycosyltransferase involved in cell wall biosynthesis
VKRAIVVGFDYYARYLANLMKERSDRWRLSAYPSSRLGTARALWAMRNADALISFGGPGPDAALTEAADARNIPVTVIWAGTDVLVAKASPFEMAITKRSGFDNISDGPWLVDELEELGIHSIYLPVTAVEVSASPAPFPPRFRVLTYLPEPRRTFYGELRVYDIARAMPDVEFVVIGNGRRNPIAPSNVTFLGHVSDVAGQIDRSTVILRLPEHDGKSMLVLETLARARHVVWTHAFTGVRAVDGTGEALTALREFQVAHSNDALPLNTVGRDFVARTFSRERIARSFESHLDKVAADWANRPQRQERRVAMSGLGLFCGQVAEQIERCEPGWKASILRTGSRLEVLAAMYRLISSDVWYSIGSPITDRWVNAFAHALRKPRVIHWVGTDIEHFRNAPNIAAAFASPHTMHLTEAPWTARELLELGLDSTIAPLPLRNYAADVKPLPARFTILLYVPQSRPDFYGRPLYESMLREFAAEGLRVYVVGGGEIQAPPGADVSHIGWQDDLRRIYEDSTVLVRLTPRDGLSLMVLEALSFGRHVIWSQPFPHAQRARDGSELSSSLRSLLDRHRAGSLREQHDAAAMVRDEYGAQKTVGQIVAALQQACK